MMGRTLIVQGSLWRQERKYEKAITCYQEALDYLKQVGDPVHQAIVHMNWGNVLYDQGQYQDSLPFFEAANVEFERVDDKLHQAACLHNLGRSRRNLQQWQQAEANYRQARKLWQELNHIENTANTLLETALVYYDQGTHQADRKKVLRAKKLLNESLTTVAQTADNPSVTELRTSITVNLERVEQWLHEY